jgi:hypothetical protein
MVTNRGVRIAAAVVAAVVGLPLVLGGAALLWADGRPGPGIRVDLLTPVALGLLLVGGLIALGCLAAAALTAYAEPPARRPEPTRAA